MQYGQSGELAYLVGAGLLCRATLKQLSDISSSGLLQVQIFEVQNVEIDTLEQR